MGKAMKKQGKCSERGYKSKIEVREIPFEYDEKYRQLIME